MAAPSMEKIVSLCKRRGFIFANSEIYGGIGSTWDYGPLGIELKNNVMRAWWRAVVYDRDDMEGLDAAILMNRLVWRYSGHEATFSDPLVDCRECGKRSRADHLQDGKCPSCGSTNLTEPRNFNLMFKTTVGPVESDENIAYLRPETAQGIFVNFNNVQQAMRRKLPFGIAQIGKAFRNEITPGNFTFRTREFEQMEIEFFCHPNSSAEWYRYWRDRRLKWYQELGLSSDRLRLREHHADELSHYSTGTADIEYAFPFLPPGEYGELEGIAHRGDFDLRSHMEGKLDEKARPLALQRVLGNLLGAEGFAQESSEVVRAEALAGATEFVGGLDNGISGVALDVGGAGAGAGVERVSDVPIHFADPLARRAPALQQTRDAAPPALRAAAATLAQLGVADGQRAKVSLGGTAVELPVVADQGVAVGTVRISAAHPDTAMLGAMFGTVTVERA